MLFLVGGCSANTPDSVRADRVATTPSPAFCAYDLTAPEAVTGELAYGLRPLHTDCIVPDGGPVFSLGFARPEWWLQFDAVRAAFTVGQPVRFEETDQAALLALDCIDWRGEFIVSQDDVHGFSTTWSVFINATCADDATRHVVGQWSGPGN